MVVAMSCFFFTQCSTCNRIQKHLAKTRKACSTTLVDLDRLQLKIRSSDDRLRLENGISTDQEEWISLYLEAKVQVLEYLSPHYQLLLTLRKKSTREPETCMLSKTIPCNQTCSLSWTCVHKEKECTYFVDSVLIDCFFSGQSTVNEVQGISISIQLTLGLITIINYEKKKPQQI